MGVEDVLKRLADFDSLGLVIQMISLMRWPLSEVVVNCEFVFSLSQHQRES